MISSRPSVVDSTCMPCDLFLAWEEKSARSDMEQMDNAFLELTNVSTDGLAGNGGIEDESDDETVQTLSLADATEAWWEPRPWYTQ